MNKTRSVLLIGLGVLIFASVQYFYPGNPRGLTRPDDFIVLAHRGMHVNWDASAYDHATGCEATHIFEPTHEFVENTLGSIRAAFDAGADMVEIDIRPSKDGVLMVNHEEDLECKTDGAGKIYDHTVAELKVLDVGYGFTHDNGRTYPLRGKGIGQMPTLQEVLTAFPDKKFLIDHKDRRQETAEILVDTVRELPSEQRQHIYYWGSPQSGDYIQSEIPEVERLFATRSEIKDCLIRYMISFGLAGFGEACSDRAIGMNRQYAKYMWGWPYRFIRKANANGSAVYLLVDNAADIEWSRDLPVDGIITDYIEVVGDAIN